MATLIERLAANLPKLRKSKGLSQDGLAEKMEVSRGTIANYERGHGGFTVDTLSKIAVALGIEETDLIDLPKEGSAVEELAKKVTQQADEIAQLKAENTKLKSQPPTHSKIPADIVTMIASLPLGKLEAVRALLKGMAADRDEKSG